MIDEELYVLATQELNSDRRRADLWDRAIALASDDHDEARYLYTNLRVEELVAERKTREQQSQEGDGGAGPEPASEPGTPAMSDTDPTDTDLGFDDMKPIPATTTPDVSWMKLKDETDGFPVAGGTPFTTPAVGADDTQDLEQEIQQDQHARITNQTNLFIDENGGSPAGELDPLERTEPEGFNMADDSMELTAPEDLPPVNLDPDYTAAPEITADNSLAATHLESTQDISDDTFDTQTINSIEDIPQAEETSANTDLPQDSGLTTVAGVAAAAAATDDSQVNAQPALRAGPAYQVLQHRDGSRAAVKLGKSVPAMLLTLPWLFYKRLWGTAIVYILMAAILLFALLSTGLGLLDAGAQASLQQKLVFGAFALLGVAGLLYIPWSQGNSWIASRLMRQGYRPKIAVNAQSARDALDIAR